MEEIKRKRELAKKEKDEGSLKIEEEKKRQEEILKKMEEKSQGGIKKKKGRMFR